MFEVNVKNVTKGRGGGPARVWGSDTLGFVFIDSIELFFSAEL